MANPFDQFDAPEANPFDQFDAPKPKAPVSGGLVAAAKQAIGGTIKGAGQAAADFLPGVDQDNALKRYGQGVVDANPTAVSSLADLKDKPLTGIAEATGNAGGLWVPCWAHVRWVWVSPLRLRWLALLRR